MSYIIDQAYKNAKDKLDAKAEAQKNSISGAITQPPAQLEQTVEYAK